MDIEYIYQLTQKGINPNKEDIYLLEDLVKKYPYFQTGIFTYLKAIYSFENENFEKELENLSIFVSDRKALFYYIFNDEYDRFFQQTGKTEIREDKTSRLLDAFFESKGDVNTTADLEYSISHSSIATTDYFTYLQVTPEKKDQEEEPIKEDNPGNLKHQNIIDDFIYKSELEGGIQIKINKDIESSSYTSPIKNSEKEDELDEDVFFTETLAKIYIKQKKYEKAYKIIKHLSLNYPKKNIYFADQLSFLEKLIINSKFKDTK